MESARGESKIIIRKMLVFSVIANLGLGTWPRRKNDASGTARRQLWGKPKNVVLGVGGQGFRLTPYCISVAPEICFELDVVAYLFQPE